MLTREQIEEIQTECHAWLEDVLRRIPQYERKPPTKTLFTYLRFGYARSRRQSNSQ